MYLFTLHPYHRPLPPLLPLSLILLPIPSHLLLRKEDAYPSTSNRIRTEYFFPCGRARQPHQGEVIKKQATEPMSESAPTPVLGNPHEDWAAHCYIYVGGRAWSMHGSKHSTFKLFSFIFLIIFRYGSNPGPSSLIQKILKYLFPVLPTSLFFS